MKICFTGKLSSSFIKNDYNILQNHFNMTIVELPKSILGCLKYPFILIKNIMDCDLTFSWFANLHSAITVFFSKLFKKKSVVVIGGYDVACVPELNYGAYTKIITKLSSEYVLNNADMVLPVSKFTMNEMLEKVIPNKFKVIYNGVDVNKFKSTFKKRNIIVTIGDKVKLKGLDMFIKLSDYFPDYTFIVIGLKKNTYYGNNLIFTGQIPHNEVLEILKFAKIYCQFSFRESFGMGLVESMSCNCIPVISNMGAIPEIVGNTGYYVDYNNINNAIDEIKKALKFGHKNNERKRVKKLYSLRLREKELVKCVKSVLNDI